MMRDSGDMTIAVIIPTFRRPEMLQSLLVSLSQGTRVPDGVIVVDNDPEKSAFPEQVPLLPVRVVYAGLGISLAGARNVGWRSAESDICFFLDDDNLVERDAVRELANAFEIRDIGLAGPVIFAGDSGTVWCAGIRRSRWTGQTRCILGGESNMPAASTWHTDDMPDAFAVPRAVMEKLDGFDEERFPIHYDESDLTARIRALGLKSIVKRDARVRHYGWVGVSPGSAMVRAAADHGVDRVRQMGLSRVRFHVMHTSGLPRLSTVGVFLPVWLVLTSVGCFSADASWEIRIRTARAVGAGVVAGYHEAMSERRTLGIRRGGQDQNSQEYDWAATDGFIGTLLPPVRMIGATALRSIAFHTGLHRLVFYRYDYMFRPRELSLLVTCVTKTHGLPGPILEIGSRLVIPRST